MSHGTRKDRGARGRPRVSITLSEANLTRLRAIAGDTSRPVSRALDDFLTSHFLEEDRAVGRLADEETIRMAKANDALRAATAGELAAPGDVIALAITLLEREARLQAQLPQQED